MLKPADPGLSAIRHGAYKSLAAGLTGPPYDRCMRLGEVHQLILREVQHEVWKRRSRGETAVTISDGLGIDVETVHAWFFAWGARQDAGYQLSRPTGALTLTFSADGCEADDLRLKRSEQP